MIPEGYVAIPFAENQLVSTLRICLLVRCQADPAGGHLVVLRTGTDARVLLGCILDASEAVQEWIEVWVQDSEALEASVLSRRVPLSNAQLDDRWIALGKALRDLGTKQAIVCGWETSNPLPTYLDLQSRRPVHPKAVDSGASWELCKDEGLLQRKGLPGYQSSLSRYLYIPALGDNSPMACARVHASADGLARPLTEICPGCSGLIPFNPAAGLMLIRRLFPLSLSEFIDLLGGKPYEGVRHGHALLPLGVDPALRDLENPDMAWSGRLLLAPEGWQGRLSEILHLKLRLLLDLVHLVHRTVHTLQTPLLNLSEESFRVDLGPIAPGLPFLWTPSVDLVIPGSAMAVDIPTTDSRYYVTPLIDTTSVYQPLLASLPLGGRALVRIRQVFQDSQTAVTVEGTFFTHERIEPTATDVVTMRITLPSGESTLYAHLEKDSALALGEWRFRTFSTAMSEPHIQDLKAAEGVPLPEVQFEIVPLLSTPCDLYSIGVLAVRILLVDNTTSLPVALDELFSLAREIQAQYDASASLASQVAKVFQADERWVASLGPHRLVAECIAPRAALSSIPGQVWWSTLSVVVRMFPGLGSFSPFRHYGDVRGGGLHTVFGETLEELQTLVLRSRSLVVGDTQTNVAISAAIQAALIGLNTTEPEMSH